ncbi:MAG: T9SS type A sorting domain-containing protein [bacterium]
MWPGDDAAKQYLIGLAPFVEDDDWNIFPNPSYNQASLELSILVGFDVEVTLLDASGKIYWNMPMHKLESDRINVETSGMPAGIYHVVLRTDHQSVVKKLVIAR